MDSGLTTIPYDVAVLREMEKVVVREADTVDDDRLVTRNESEVQNTAVATERTASEDDTMQNEGRNT